MDLHFASEKVASLKDAALRYIVIVAGILTALVLNQVIESRQHARLASQTQAAIEAELRRNEVLLAGVLNDISKQLSNLKSAEDLLGADSFANLRLDANSRSILKGNFLDGVGNITIAGMQRSAWDGAIASQALQYLPADRVASWARTYSAITEMGIIVRQLATSDRTFQNVWIVDAFARGDSSDAMKFARAIREQRLTLKLVEANYASLLEALKATRNKPKDNTAAASAPG